MSALLPSLMLAVSLLQSAEAPQPRLALLALPGARSDALAQAILVSLGGRESFAFMASADATQRLRRLGVPAKDDAAAARALGAAMVLRTTVLRSGGREHMVFTLRDNAGRELGRVSYAMGKNLFGKIERLLYGDLLVGITTGVRRWRETHPSPRPPATPGPASSPPAGSPLASSPPASTVSAPTPPVAPSAAAPSAPLPAVAPSPFAEPPPPAAEVAAEPQPTPEVGRPDPVLLDFAFGGGTLTRNLRYIQDLFGSLGAYTLDAGALLGGAVVVYPLGLWTSGWAANLGISGSLDTTVGLGSSLAGGFSYPTHGDFWTLGLRGRIPLDPFDLGVDLGYGREDFELGTPVGAAPPAIPDYRLGFLRGGADVRWTLLPALAVLANANYLLVVDDGIKQTEFPHSSVGGISGGLGVGIGLLDWLELRISGDYEQFFYSFHSQPGDPYVAAGARDQYLQATLALAIRLR